MITIGLIREGKTPPDRRVALAPEQAAALMSSGKFTVLAQSSPIRAYGDDEYSAAGVTVTDDLSPCDIILGVKEVPVDMLMTGKHYMFFSHVIKKQPYNQKLMQAMVQKSVTLTDYECLRDKNGNRILGFGKYAGIVGVYNGLRAWGLRHGTFSLKPAHECFDYEDLKREVAKAALPAIKIVLTGAGRVGQGAAEILDVLGIRHVSPDEFLNTQFTEAVFTQIDVDRFYAHKDGRAFDMAELTAHPDRFQSAFLPYAAVADMFAACHYWDPASPRFFTRDDMKSPDFKIKVIADITCDIDGSVPSTVRASTIADPFYGFDPAAGCEVDAFAVGAVTVMAVDNLPCELPRDASRYFGGELMAKVLPLLAGDDADDVIGRATLLRLGKLTAPYDYLADFAYG